MPEVSRCPSPELLQQLAGGVLPEAEALSLRQHVNACAVCSQALSRLKGAHLTPTVNMEIAGIQPAAEHRQTETVAEAAALSPLPSALAKKLSFLAPPQQADEIGRLGAYRILKVLGEGGMGMVFQAQDIALERMVALKVMKPECAADDVGRQRFLQEAKVAASLQHDHIVTIYQVGEDQGIPFLAMQFLRGEPLDARLQREGPLPIGEALRIGREIAEGLAAAHERGLIHRDIKPGNIWLEVRDQGSGIRSQESGISQRSGGRDQSRVKILDFGLARVVGKNAPNLTQTGTVVGTPAYMAPEQARGQPLDHRCDLFSLGCVIYHMCAGREPFQEEDALSTLLAVTSEEPFPLRRINPDIPGELATTISALMAKHPGDRLQSAHAAIEELRFIEQKLAAAANPVSAPPDDENEHAQEHPSIPATNRARARIPDPNRTTPAGKRAAGFTSAETKPEVRAPVEAHPPVVDSRLEQLGLSSCDETELIEEPIKAPAPPAPIGSTPPLAPLPSSGSGLDARLAAQKPSAPKKSFGEGACPRCGSKRFSSIGQGWCFSCGYTPSTEKEEVQKSTAPKKGSGTGWTFLAGILVVAGVTVFGHLKFPRSTENWERWIWGQMVLGLAAMLIGFLWAYFVVWQYHDNSRSIVPLFLMPIRLLSLVFHMLPRTRAPLYLGSWGLMAAVAVGYIVGNPANLWKGKGQHKIGITLPSVPPIRDKRAQPPAEKKLETEAKLALRCTVIGYIPGSDQSIAGIVLAEKFNGKLRYVGVAYQTQEKGKTEEIGKRLASLRRGEPVIPVEVRGAQWVEPKVECNVEYSGRDVNEVLENIVINSWER